MKLNEKDNKLLGILLILVILVVPYLLIISPFYEKTRVLNSEVAELEARYTYLQNLDANRVEYQEKVKEYHQLRQDMLDLFPADIEQEASIVFISATEKLLPASLRQISFTQNYAAFIEPVEEVDGTLPTEEGVPEEGAVENPEPYQEEGEGPQTPGEIVDAVKDDPILKALAELEGTEEEKAAMAEAIALGDGLIGITGSTQISYECSYMVFKQMLNYIKQYEERMVMSTLSASYNEEEEIVSGVFTLEQYAVKGLEREYTEVQVPEVNIGNGNIFVSGSGISGVTEGSASNSPENVGDAYDYFMMLAQPEADVEAKIIGKTNDGAGESYINSDLNSKQEMTITFTGKEGEYAVSYAVGKTRYPSTNYAKGEPFDPGATLDLLIISSPRVGDNDKVGANVNIHNKTDLPCTVTLLEEDPENPRIDFKGKTGEVILP